MYPSSYQLNRGDVAIEYRKQKRKHDINVRRRQQEKNKNTKKNVKKNTKKKPKKKTKKRKKYNSNSNYVPQSNNN